MARRLKSEAENKAKAENEAADKRRSKQQAKKQIAAAAAEGVRKAAATRLVAKPILRLYVFKTGKRMFIMSYCMYCTVLMRCNLGVAIVCMVNVSYTSSLPVGSDTGDLAVAFIDQHNLSQSEEPPESDKCGQLVVSSKGYDGTLNWSLNQQSELFSTLFYGSIITIGISGWISDQFSPKVLVGIAMAINSIFSFCIPYLAQASVYYFMVARFIMGLAEGFVFPSITSMLAPWFPRSERSTVVGIYTSGNQIASSVGVLITSKLCGVQTFAAYGWPNIFYYTGISSLIFLILWMIFVSDSPAESRFISKNEKLYIASKLSDQASKLNSGKITPIQVPWVAMITSPATLSGIVAQFSVNFSNTMLQGFLPSYFRDVLRLDLSSNGFYSAIPFITQLIFKIIFGVGADSLKRRGWLSDTAACKILQCFSNAGSALVLISMAMFVDCTRPILSLILLALFGVFFAGAMAGAFTALLSIAPPFTGTLTSLCSLSGSLANIVAPTIIGIINTTGSRAEWSMIFFIAAAVNIICGLQFLIYGTAEVQPWAKPLSPEKVAPSEKVSSLERVQHSKL